MENNILPEGQQVKHYRKSLRLRFRAAEGEVKLLSYERLNMICPSSVGERPEEGKHGGFWMELRDANDRVLFHRILHSPLGDSVEIHSPDGKIRRVFGEVKENVFEVLLPDVTNASFITLIGESRVPAEAIEKRTGGSSELSRFNVPIGEKGGEQ